MKWLRRGRFAIVAVQSMAVVVTALGAGWHEPSWLLPVLVGGACVAVPEIGFAMILGRLQSAGAIVAGSMLRFACVVICCAVAMLQLPALGVPVVLGLGVAVLARMFGSLLSFNKLFGSRDAKE